MCFFFSIRLKMSKKIPELFFKKVNVIKTFIEGMKRQQKGTSRHFLVSQLSFPASSGVYTEITGK